MNWAEIVNSLLGELGALVAFFAYPALQYFFLRRLARREGQPELWYLPRYGLRLVMRNLPRRRTFTGIRYRALIRTLIPAGPGASVATLQDTALGEGDDFFLFPGTDQLLVSFRLEADATGTVTFVHTDKLGETLSRRQIGDESRLVVDFIANLENTFNFDISIARRVELHGSHLREIAQQIAGISEERHFAVSRVREIE
jgi:hypothetical protein